MLLLRGSAQAKRRDAVAVRRQFPSGDSLAAPGWLQNPQSWRRRGAERVARVLSSAAAWLRDGEHPTTGDGALAQLLGRQPVALDVESLRSVVRDRAILVTGAAGSIGSELCRQIVMLEPRLLVAFDNSESGLFRIDQELRRCFPRRCVIPCVGDVRDARRVEEVLRLHAPEAVFHAAAYKHVPLMETHPLELIQTNIVGTWNLARAAAACRVGRFVLVSTDKAVNPANVMGLTKRIAELVVAGTAGSGPGASGGAGNARCGTKFAVVRFGNVLGSSGSVVPIFQEQIARGGPLTVTHPEVRRYFMTTHEAVHLLLQASVMARRSETFLLEMGEPIRIADLARSMIRLAGLEPDRDIEIRYVGLRPGEKLDEELVGPGEQSLPTNHTRICALRGTSISSSRIEAWMEEMYFTIARRDEAAAISHMAALAPEYEPGEAWVGLQSRRSVSIPAAVG